MALSVPILARLAIRGRLQWRRANGTVIKEVEIIDGELPIVRRVPREDLATASALEHPHDPGHQ